MLIYIIKIRYNNNIPLYEQILPCLFSSRHFSTIMRKKQNT